MAKKRAKGPDVQQADPKAALKPDEARAARDEFASLTEAESWLGGLQEAIGSLSRTELAEAILSVERTYEQFPELAVRFPRRAVLRHFRTAAAALPDAEAVPLLLLCAAAEPSDAISLAGLLERAARAGGSAALFPLLRLFQPYTDLGWEEIGPAVTALAEGGAGAAALLESVGEILGGTEHSPATAAALGRVLAPLLSLEPTVINPAALARGAAGARRRLAEAAVDCCDEERGRRTLALAERLRARLRPPARPPGGTPVAWPPGEPGLPSFLAQWPDLAIEVPARQLYTRYAVLDPDGALRAERHAGGAFCYGPYLNLPAGRYRVRIDGEAASGAEYVARITRSLGDRGPAPVCERRYVRQSRVVGVIAELAFASDIALRNFEVVVDVASPSIAAFAIASVAITADRLRPDPED
jgi:hypothetical protein